MTLFELRASLSKARALTVVLRDTARLNPGLVSLRVRLEKLADDLNRIENDVIAAGKIE